MEPIIVMLSGLAGALVGGVLGVAVIELLNVGWPAAAFIMSPFVGAFTLVAMVVAEQHYRRHSEQGRTTESLWDDGEDEIWMN